MSSFPRYIYWELCSDCNLKCLHCFAESNHNMNTRADKGALLSKILEIEQFRRATIRFGGGEPLLYPELIEVLSFCRDNNVSTAITTNGTLITKQMANQLASTGIKMITISFDGLEQYNDQMRGTGNFSKALKGLSFLLSSGVIPSVAFTITHYNYLNIFEYVSFFTSLGIQEFYFFRCIPNVSQLEKFSLDANELMLATRSILTLKKQYPHCSFHYERLGHLSFLIDNEELPAICNFQAGVMTIKCDGTVVVCAAISKPMGNIFKDDLQHILELISKEQTEMQRCPDECFLCLHKEVCNGGCKFFSYEHYDDYAHKDRGCYLSLLK